MKNLTLLSGVSWGDGGNKEKREAERGGSKGRETYDKDVYFSVSLPLPQHYLVLANENYLRSCCY